MGLGAQDTSVHHLLGNYDTHERLKEKVIRLLPTRQGLVALEPIGGALNGMLVCREGVELVGRTSRLPGRGVVRDEISREISLRNERHSS